jgi:hypothetical protein
MNPAPDNMGSTIEAPERWQRWTSNSLVIYKTRLEAGALPRRNIILFLHDQRFGNKDSKIIHLNDHNYRASNVRLLPPHRQWHEDI